MSENKTNELLVAEYHKNKSESIMEEILRKNKPFVVRVARNCMPRERSDLNYEDLIQVGYTALIDAVKGFNTEQSYSKFLSYAGNLITWRIKREIGKVNKQANGMGVNTVHDIFKVNKKKESIIVKTGKEPSNKELAESLNISVVKLEQLLEMERYLQTKSLNQSLIKDSKGDGDVELENIIESNNWDKEYTNVELKLDIKKSMEILSKSEKRYFELFLKDYDNKEIARELKITPRKGYKIKSDGLKKLKPLLGDYSKIN